MEYANPVKKVAKHDFIRDLDTSKMPIIDAAEIARIINTRFNRKITTTEEIHELKPIRTAEEGGYMVYAFQWQNLTIMVRADTKENIILEW